MTKFGLAATASAIAIALCAATLCLARADAARRGDFGFCFGGIERTGGAAGPVSYFSDSEPCADTGGYGALHVFIYVPKYAVAPKAS